MKELQNSFTTPEQSRRLIELGVPVDSADMLYCRYRGRLWGDPEPCYRKYSEYSVDSSFEMLPCWSALKLVEILGICAGMESADVKALARAEGTWQEKLIRLIEYLVKYDKLTFSELEE